MNINNDEKNTIFAAIIQHIGISDAVKRKKMVKKGIIGLLTLLMFFSCGHKETEGTKAPLKVKTEVVGTSQGEGGQTYVGIVEEREATAVSFTSMGVVKHVYVTEGQAVGRGQLLAEIDATTVGNSVEAAKATTSQAQDMVVQAEQMYAQAKDAYDRMKLLHDNGSLPEINWIEMETKLHQAEAALHSARASVQQAAATEKIARKGLSDTRLVAPVSGIVGRKLIGAGETALPSQSVVTILDISTVKVKVSIPEAEMSSITPSTRTTINVEAVDKNVQGGHIEKGVQADALTHTYDIRISVPNVDHKLLPGMVANVRFLDGNNATDNLCVPITSVQKRSDGSLFVWLVAEDNTVHRTTVHIGDTIGNNVVILGGISEGQRIVTEGYQKLSEGNKVEF